MQDIHSIGSGGGGRLFGVGDRRLRPHYGQNHQVLKCPRCESVNTKFCYYNNYNQSQPRHFCKSCRRYWTKGGVLRNVPVGGGCRKTKRSKPKASSSDAAPKELKSSNSQNSSSESSSLTASTTAATTPTATASATALTEVVSGSSSNSAPTLLNFQETRFFSIPQSSTANPSFDPPVMDHSPESGMFSEIGTFTSLMTSSNDPIPLGFNSADISMYRMHQQGQGQVVENQSSDQQWLQQQQQQKTMEDEVRMHEITGSFLDQTAQMEYVNMQNRISNGGLATVDWQAGGDQGLFDLSGTVDQSYWSQTQWPEHEHEHQLNYLP